MRQSRLSSALRVMEVPQPKNSLITMKVMAATTTQNMGQASGALPAMCWLMN
ncbi:Uncharacterised protein [Mycobacterium tuberculosis]|nr:Uncharacterised protein [Mycobacterium tuberculosis]